MKEKKCINCNEVKPLTDEYFQFRNDRKEYRNQCRACRKGQYVDWNKSTGWSKIYYIENKDKKLNNNKEWRKNNNRKEYHKNWLQNNKEKRREYNKEYTQIQRKNNPKFKIRKNVANRIQKILKKGKCGKKTQEILGCSSDELIIHIEKQFKEGMNWGNYGYNGWHLDHKKPISLFDLTNPDEIKEAFNYKNLQPLWWSDNLSKGNRRIDV